MFAGPIFTVELLTGARRARYFVVRVIYASILLFAMWMVYLATFTGEVSNIRADAARASTFFYSFAIIQLLAVLIVGPAMVAGTIAQERERRTIEYLLATDLSNTEIVLGKLAARIVYIVAALLVGLPVLALVGLMGGVRPEDQLLVFVLTASTTMAISSLSMATSVWARRSRDAMARIYLILITLLIVPLVARVILPSIDPPRGLQWLGDILWGINEVLLQMNPVYVFALILGQNSKDLAEIWQRLWPMLAGHAGTSLFCALLAIFSLRRAYLSSVGVSKQPGKRRRRWQPRPSIGTHAMLWKELYAERRSMRIGWVARVALLLLVGCALGPSVWLFLADDGGSGISMFAMQITMIATLVATLGVIMVAARAATCVTAEKERDCWVSLISTPLSGSEIVIAKLLGNLYAGRGLYLMMGILWLLIVLREPRFLPAVPFLFATLLVTCLFAAMLGMMFSLWCRNSLRALGGTLGTILYVGGGYALCCVPCLALAGGGGDEIAVVFSGVIPFLQAIPAAVAVQWIENQRFDPDESVAPYIVGMFGYLAAALVLLTSCVGNFERFAGRNHGLRPGGDRPPVRPIRDVRKATPEEPPAAPVSRPPPD